MGPVPKANVLNQALVAGLLDLIAALPDNVAHLEITTDPDPEIGAVIKLRPRVSGAAEIRIELPHGASRVFVDVGRDTTIELPDGVQGVRDQSDALVEATLSICRAVVERGFRETLVLRGNRIEQSKGEVSASFGQIEASRRHPLTSSRGKMTRIDIQYPPYL
jgi:hypothetical protein